MGLEKYSKIKKLQWFVKSVQDFKDHGVDLPQYRIQDLESVVEVLKDLEDLCSLFMADEESRYRQAIEEKKFYGVDTLNRLCRFWGVSQVEPIGYNIPTEE